MSIIFVDSWAVCIRSNIHYQCSFIDRLIYNCLTKERPWLEHLYKPKWGVGCPLSDSAFNHEEYPFMLTARVGWMITWNGLQALEAQVLMAHTLWMATCHSQCGVTSSASVLPTSIYQCHRVITFSKVLHKVSYLRYAQCSRLCFSVLCKYVPLATQSSLQSGHSLK